MKEQGKGPSWAWSMCELKDYIIRDAPVGEGDRSGISFEESLKQNLCVVGKGAFSVWNVLAYAHSSSGLQG